MPSKTEPQARLMAGIAHGWHPSGMKRPPPVSVAKDFNQADKGSALLHNAMKRRRHFAAGGSNMPLSMPQNSPYLQALIARANAGNQGGAPGFGVPSPQQPPQQPQRPMGPPPGALGMASAPPPPMPMGGGMRPGMPMGGGMRPGMMPGRPMMPGGGMPGMMPNPGMVNGGQPGMPGQNPMNRPMTGMARGGRPTGYDLGGPTLANFSAGSPLSAGISSMHNPMGGNRMNVGSARMRMPRIPIADTLRNIDQGLHSTSHIMKPKMPHLAEGGLPPQGGGAPQLGPQAIAALGMAMAHAQGGDHGSAAGALMSSPEAMQHPHVRAIAHHLKASKDIGQAHEALSNLVNSLGSGGGPGATAAPPVAGKRGPGGAQPPPSGMMPGGMKKGGATQKRKDSGHDHRGRAEIRR